MAAAGGIPEALYAPAAAGGTIVPRNTRLSRPAVRCPAQSAPSAGRLRRHHPTGSGGGTISIRRSAGYRCAVLRGVQRLFSGDRSAHSSRRQHGISPVSYTHLDVYKRQDVPSGLVQHQIHRLRCRSHRPSVHQQGIPLRVCLLYTSRCV